jgi:hypothetical protein
MTEPVNLHLAPLDQQLVAFLRRQPDGVSSPYAIATELNLSAEAVRFAQVFRGNHGGLSGDEMETLLGAQPYG